VCLNRDYNLFKKTSSIIKPHKDLIEKISSVVCKKGMSGYLVGGYVRDLIIGNLSTDIDLVIEGDAVDFAKSVMKLIPGKLKVFEQFKTAKLVVDKNLQIDFATARTELYESPAALPKVTASDLKKDLFRRDFTVNALAVSLNKENYGFLIDCFDGLQDIKNKEIKVLHDQSFIDDPTRIFRAIRFAYRLGFKIEDHTFELMKEAVKNRIIERLDRYRLNNEIVLIRAEADSDLIIERVEHLLGAVL
jgi:tRNA nucleotidyltransferase (CCA-adding enzyme)